jgi:c-di-GMP-binding flagellar brake protein YcgR
MRTASEQQVEPTLGVGQRLEIGIGAAEADVAWYASRLEDLTSEQLSVAWPIDRERRLVPVQPGQHLQVATTTPDALYSARGVVEATQREPLPMLSVRLEGPWQRAQRRGNVRASVAIKPRLAMRLLADGTQQPLRLGLTNISAGGVQVRSQDELHHGDVLLVAFELMGVPGELEVKLRVQRVERSDRGSLPIWDAGCAFVDLPARTADQIVQFIFAQQRALARARRS